MDLFGLSSPTSADGGTHLPPRPDPPGNAGAPAIDTFTRLANILGLDQDRIDLGQKVMLEVSPYTFRTVYLPTKRLV